MRRAGESSIFSFSNQFIDMIFSPLAEGVKDFGQCEAVFTQSIFYVRRYFLINLSCDNLAFLQFPELLDSVTAKDTVTIDILSNKNSNLYGIYVYNEEAKGGKTELSFEKDASVKTVSEKGMATALLLQNEYGDAFVKNAKGTTLHLSAKGEQATYGIHEHLNKGKSSINAEGNVVIEASSSAETSTGWRLGRKIPL